MPPCCLAQLSSEACVTAVLTGKGPVKIPATPCDPVSYPTAESCQPTVELSTLPVLPAVFMGPIGLGCLRTSDDQVPCVSPLILFLSRGDEENNGSCGGFILRLRT